MQNTLTKDRLTNAFRHDYNRIALASIVAISAALLNPIVLMIGLAIEVAYLLIITMRPGSEAKEFVSNQYEAQVTANRVQSAPRQKTFPQGQSLSKEAILPLLREEVQDQYDRIESLCRVVEVQTDKQSPVVQELQSKMDYLKGKYLLFALREEQFRERLFQLSEEAKQLSRDKDQIPSLTSMPKKPMNHLHLASSDFTEHNASDQWLQKTVKEAHEGYERELSEIANDREKTADANIAAQLEKRAMTLLRRNKSVDKIAKMLTNLHYELQLLYKKFESTCEELRTRTPEQVLSDISALVVQTDSMTRSLEEAEPFDDLTQTAAA